MNNPKISVIIPLYNHEKYINETVCSVLEQTVSDFELIIINDGSIDRSEEIVKQIKDERIKYYYQENKGAHNTINRGIKLAKGEYISILNSDDVYYTNRFEEFLKILDVDSNINAVFSHIELIDDQGNHIRYKKGAEDNWANHNLETSFKNEDNIILDLLAGCFLVTTSNLFCRKSVFRDIGFFFNLRYSHDYEFFLRLCYHTKVHIKEAPLLKYRIHSSNTIRENEPAVSFEIGLILSNFFLNYDLQKVFSDNNIYTTMLKFFNSINTYNSDRMIMILVLFGLKYNIGGSFLGVLTENSENPFRTACIDYLTDYIDVWQDSQKAWKKWTETNDRLTEADKKLSETANEAKKWRRKWTETNEGLIETEKKLQGTEQELYQIRQTLAQVCNSYTYRLGSIFRDARYSKKRCLLFPLRFIWFFLPLQIKTTILKNFHDIQHRFAVKKPKIKRIRNLQWYSLRKNRPLVSIVIPCFNYGEYVEEAIDSVLAQTFQNYEIIVVDGGSNDHFTIQKLGSLKKPKTKIFFRKGRHLVGDNRNFGIKKAKGKYICCLDADDMIKPTYLEKSLFLAETYYYDLVYPAVQCFGKSDELWQTSDVNFSTCVEINGISTVALFKKKAWKKVGGFRDFGVGEHYVYEDWDFWVRILGHGFRCKNILEPLMLYRVHDKGLTAQNKMSYGAHSRKIKEANTNLLKPKNIKRIFKKLETKYEVESPHINLTTNLPDRNNILFALPFIIIGGADKVLLQIGHYLKEHNFNLSYVTTEPTEPSQGDNTLKFEEISNEIYHLPHFLNDQSQWKSFIFYVIETKNITTIFLAGSAFLYHMLPELKKRYPHINIVDQLFNEYGHVENNRRYSRYIDLNIVENLKVKNVLIYKYKEKQEKVSLIHNSVNVDEFSPENVDTAEVYKKYPYLKDKTVISYFGRFSEEKSPDLFVEIADYFKYHDDVIFFMGGNGSLFKQIKLRIKEYELEYKVYTPGFVNTKECLAISNIVLLPSRIDGRPNIVLESMAMGVPVVASNVGGLSELIDNGHNGFLCEIGDVKSFVFQIKQLLENKDLYKQMKKNVRDYAVNKLDANKMLRDYLKIFDSLSEA